MKHKLKAIIKYQYDSEQDLNTIIYFEYMVDHSIVYSVHGQVKEEQEKLDLDPINWAIDSGFSTEFGWPVPIDQCTIKIESIKG